MQLGVRVLLRDGTHLSAILYRPANPQSPTPAIFTLTPYIAQVHHDQGVFFAANGYPYLTVNVRGRGDSEGTFEADGSEEARDAYDITEWLARQPFCNGKVTMWGGSYSGYVQWAAAKEFPPHLATIVPVASPFRGVDSPMRNNIFATYRIQWLTYLSGRAAHDKVFADQVFWRQQFRRWLESGTPFRELDTFVGNPSAIFRKWVSHPRRDAFWDAFNPAPEDYARIAIPILTITGIYDGNQPGALAHYREHMRHGSAENRARHYLIIGPWDHGGTRVPRQEFCGLRVGAESLIDLPRLHLEWYAWTMAEGPKPEFLKRNVAYYVMGAERWRYADSLDAITARVVPLYLHSSSGASDVLQSGSLLAEPDVGGTADQYTYDPRDVSLAELESSVDPESRTDQHMVYASVGRQLVYHSAPYQVDTEVSGFFRLT
jgi:putative CocE/NonD family hydrolase